MSSVAGPNAGPATDELGDLLEFVKRSRGFDFTGYKRPSLERRIAKRMEAVRAPSYADYREYLAGDPDEFAALFDTVLINVTTFFRDPAAWQLVADMVLPDIRERKAPGDPIRVWSAGCASGEEAYTIAMLLAEELGEDEFTERAKVYATDLDEDALTLGRHASYTPKQLESVPPPLRERYFEPVNSRFGFRRDLRRNVIFGRHDLIQDPPISRVDLLVARNTLMYFGAPAQGKILASFHFSLVESGYLFLGMSESLLVGSRLFAPVDGKRRVFTKSDGSEVRPLPLQRVAAADGALHRDGDEDDRIRQAGFEASPVAQLVIDRAGILGMANVQARRLFGLSQKDIGRPLHELEVAYRPLDLRSRLDETRSVHRPVLVRDVEWRIGGEQHVFDVQVSPLKGPEGTPIGFGVAFVDATRYRKLHDSVEQARERLETAYEELQSTAEELETTNEELQSTNEELETTNEELQSTNEELETMNEELQSTNEELGTMNDELRQRTDDLHESNAFLQAILGSMRAGVAVLDRELRVQAWNEYSAELWGLRSDEVRDRHLMNLDFGLPLEPVVARVRSCLAGDPAGAMLVVDAVNRRGKSIRCRVACAPLLGRDGAIDGVVVQMEEGG